jgi:hypothetical protein
MTFLILLASRSTHDPVYGGQLFEEGDELDRPGKLGAEADSEGTAGVAGGVAGRAPVQADVGRVISEQKHANGREQLGCQGKGVTGRESGAART